MRTAVLNVGRHTGLVPSAELTQPLSVSIPVFFCVAAGVRRLVPARSHGGVCVAHRRMRGGEGSELRRCCWLAP